MITFAEFIVTVQNYSSTERKIKDAMTFLSKSFKICKN